MATILIAFWWIQNLWICHSFILFCDADFKNWHDFKLIIELNIHFCISKSLYWGGSDEDVKIRIGKARGSFKTLWKIWDSKVLLHKKKISLFNLNEKSILLYGYVTWKHKKIIEKRLQVFARSLWLDGQRRFQTPSSGGGGSRNQPSWPSKRESAMDGTYTS